MKKRVGTYPLIMVLILQFSITSLLCAISSYQASANTITICTSFGIKTITIDENGQPIEQESNQEVHQTCFHCGSGSCSMAVLSHAETEIYVDQKQRAQTTSYRIARLNTAALSPPSRAPPTSLS